MPAALLVSVGGGTDKVVGVGTDKLGPLIEVPSKAGVPTEGSGIDGVGSTMVGIARLESSRFTIRLVGREIPGVPSEGSCKRGVVGNGGF